MRKNFLKHTAIPLAALLILVFLLQPFSARAIVVVDTVSVDVMPSAMTTLGTKVYVAGSGAGVSIIDTADNNSVTSVETGGGLLDIITLGTKVYTANSGSNSVTIIDTANNNSVTSVSVGSNPYYLTSLGTKVYVSNIDDGTVSVIDADTDAVVDTIGVGGKPAKFAVVGNKVYVADEGDGSGNSVIVIDTTNGNSTSSIPVGLYPIGMAVLNNKIYVANGSEPTVTVIDSGTDTVVSTLNMPGNPGSIAAFGSKVYVGIGGDPFDTVSIINTNNSDSVTNITVLGQAVFTALGNRVYALKRNNGSSLVTAIDKNTDSVIATLTVESDYNGKAIAALGDKLYVANSNNTVSVLKTIDPIFTAPASHYSLSGTIAITASADGVDGVSFYVDNTAIGSEDTTDPYEVSWDTTQVTDGAHTLYAVSRTNGNEYSTTTFSVAVHNTSAAATLYFSDVNTNDNDWANINNWWTDEAHTQPSGLPTINDNAIILTNVSDNSGSPVSVRSLTVNNHSFGINATVSAAATFNGGGALEGTITGNVVFNNEANNLGTVTGNSIFRDESENNGVVSGNATFNHESINKNTVSGTGTFNNYSYNTGNNAHVYGVATFNDGSYNEAYVDNSAVFNGGSTNEGTISGNAIFNGNSNASGGTITGSATFNDRAYAGGGTISGSATFTGSVYPVSPIGTANVGGNITFTNNVVFTIHDFVNWAPTTPATGWTFLGTKSWIFYDQTSLEGSIPGDATFNDLSTNVSTVQGNATFGCGAVNGGSVLGVTTNQSNCMYFQGSGDGEWSNLDNWYTDRDYVVHTLALPGPDDNVVLLSGGVGTNVGAPASVASLLVYASQFFISATVSREAAFVNTASFDSGLTGATLNGNARFMGSSVNYGNIAGDASFEHNSILSSSGSVTGNATFGGSSENQSVNIGGSMTFNGGSKNTAVNLAGNPTFNDSSYNNGSISSGATFNGGSYNKLNTGTVSGLAVFNDYSYNDYTVGEGAVFNDSAYNNRTSGSATFNGRSYNMYDSAEVSGPATFNGSSHNGGTVTGDAVFACEATNSGVVEGTISQAVCLVNSGDSGQSGGDNYAGGWRTGGSTSPLTNSNISSSSCPIGYICTKNTGNASTAANNTDKTFKFLKNLKFRSVDADVVRLQQFLKSAGFLSAGPDGKFGPVTRSALIKFQKAKKIKPAAGYFGPVTRGVVNGILNSK